LRNEPGAAPLPGAQTQKNLVTGENDDRAGARPLREKTMIRPFAIAALLACLMPGVALAQAGYPSKPIRLIIPFPPGGSTDILGRVLAQQLSDAWKQQVVPDNRGGAGGTIGAELAAKSPADGYTLMMGHIGTLAVNVSLYPKLAYDPLKDFQPVSLVAMVPNVLVVHPSVPAINVQQLIAWLRANPGKANYSSGGNGSGAHLAVEYFKLETKTNIVHVPYKGTAPSVTDLIAGQVNLTMTGAPAVMGHVQSGKLRALAVTSAKRVDALPQIPTVAESGVPGFDATQWYGVVVPAGTPRDIVMKLNAEVRTIMQTKEMHDRLATDGATAATNSPEEFAAFIKSEIGRWAAVVKAANMRPD
jgi:tripartite-type tricarboxylate transporter receptor subunit TctC